MRHLAGVDINGWHDWAARNWSEDDDEPVEVETVDGGIASRIIYAGDAASTDAIGGPQAALAPHGRGNGWGPIGSTDRRRTIRKLLSLPFKDVDRSASVALSAAVNALGLDARRIVFAVPDNPEQMDEARQTLLLSLLRQPKRPLPVLLWKQVAVVLAEVAGGGLSTADLEREIDVICHDGGGLSVQTLRLVVPTGLSQLLTPERKGFGRLVANSLGLQEFADALRKAWMAANPVLAESGVESHAEPEKWLMDPSGIVNEHVLRKANGDWVKITRPVSLALSAWNKRVLEQELLPCLIGTGDILLHTPMRPDLAKDLATCLSDISGRGVHKVSKDGIARGCLEAAKRIEKGLPHYLDRLEQVSLVVMEKGEPKFRDLVPKGQTVPANKTFISEPISDLGWPKGSTEQIFYVRKGENEIRKWTITDFIAPTSDQQVVMQLSQMPAQGWAKVEITSPTWLALQQNPIRLDWETMPIEAMSAAEVLDRLRTPPPVVPLRTEYKYSLDLWEGIEGQPGLAEALTRFDLSSRSIPDSILQLVTRHYKPIGSAEKFFCVSSDGDLPDVPAAAQFDHMLGWASGLLLEHAKKRRPLADNDLLRFVTWSFARCPKNVQEEMIKALDDKNHPFAQPTAARTVILQGLGRTVTDEEQIRRTLDKLSSDPNLNMNGRACIAFLLSRKKAAPRVLNDILVRRIAGIAEDAIRVHCSEKKFLNDFNYSLQLVGGLLRYREFKPHALVTQTSSDAQILEKSLGKAKAIMQKNSAVYHKKISIVTDLIDMLSGTGGNRNILYAIENE